MLIPPPALHAPRTGYPLANGVVRGKNVVARRIAMPAEAQDCHVLFISASEERRLPEIVQALNHRDVLTVSDIPQFALRGGMIQFVNDKNRIRLRINLEAAQAANIVISSKLLRVAEIVGTPKR